MKKFILSFISCILLFGFVSCKQDDVANDLIETASMFIAYEMKNDFVWTEDADAYYQAIMEGKISLDGAKAAESYLRTQTHPVIANRLVKIATKVGFEMDAANHIVGINEVNIPMLKAAAQGFKMGLLLE